MIQAVRAAGRMCRAVQAELVAAATVEKDDSSPVTIADLAGQCIVTRRMRAAAADIPMMGEEDASVLRGDDRAAVRAGVVARVRGDWPGATEDDVLAILDTADAAGGPSQRFFTLDPIDGTKGFLRGDQYAVALGLVEGGREVAGVLCCPNLPTPDGRRGLVLAALRGGGARWLSLDDEDTAGAPIHVSPLTDPRGIRRLESVEKAHSHRGVAAQVCERLGVRAEPVRIDSQAKYAALARGDAELYLRVPRDATRAENVWDHAAGALIVEEAGGRVTDLDGRPLDFGRGTTLAANRGILASNGPVHDAVLTALASLS